MFFDTLVDDVRPQILDQFHFYQIADLVAFEVQYAPEDVHQGLLSVQYEILKYTHCVLVLYLVDVESDEEGRERGSDREVLLF